MLFTSSSSFKRPKPISNPSPQPPETPNPRTQKLRNGFRSLPVISVEGENSGMSVESVVRELRGCFLAVDWEGISSNEMVSWPGR
ncbi:hypothetical protein COLO4_16286 [Corchorus olitorius]|uniref:Uncharacterized protein n=1 Tax=Corchorus olitorius TaxID=93759 RepID=A0A1R3JIH1_9ROSI|nr:hypothetical protein COLO4_16286 [Corchorus olitorius]